MVSVIPMEGRQPVKAVQSPSMVKYYDKFYLFQILKTKEMTILTEQKIKTEQITFLKTI